MQGLLIPASEPDQTWLQTPADHHLELSARREDIREINARSRQARRRLLVLLAVPLIVPAVMILGKIIR